MGKRAVRDTPQLALFTAETLEDTALRRDVHTCVVRFSHTLAAELIAANKLTLKQFRRWRRTHRLPEGVWSQ